MRLRGPDAAGEWRGVVGGNPLTLLHTRLSILDVGRRADQPYRKDGVVLIYNGEIYNYIELRAELEARQHHFQTTSDTEVIVEAYRRWGADCVARFEGMWAFALCDLNTGTLLLSRDRFGEKPLWWTLQDGTLYFASQTQFLWPLLGRRLPINRAQIRRYLVNGYKSLHKQSATYYEGVASLPPASSAVLRAPAAPEPKRYWQLRYDPKPMSLKEAEEAATAHVERSVKLRLRSDVPIAFCLSGGVDSTTLTAIAAKLFGQKVHAYSIYDSDDRYDESDNVAQVVADLGCEHHITRTQRSHFLDRMHNLVAYHDAPVATISFYAQSFLTEAINAQGYKVAITGNGADELFTGYYDHYNLWLATQSKQPRFDQLVADWRDSYGRYVRNPVLSDPECFVKAPDRRDHIYLNRDVFAGLMREPYEEDFFEADYKGDLLRRRMQNEVWHETLPVLLDENDLVCMQSSIENRTPYLDRELAEFMFSVPGEHLIHDGYTKWLLRVAAKGRVPDAVRLDRRKRGFNAPLESFFDWKSSSGREWLLSDNPIFDLVDRGRFSKFLDQADERNSFSKYLFSFISARMFLGATQ
jgi:asparagine synthase (glutamine-hydrolysing)